MIFTPVVQYALTHRMILSSEVFELRIPVALQIFLYLLSFPVALRRNSGSWSPVTGLRDHTN